MPKVHMEMLLVIPVIYLVIETILGYKRGLIKSVLLLISWIVSLGGSALLVREFVTGSEKMKEFAVYFEDVVGTQYSNLAACVFLFLLLVLFIKMFCHIIIRFSGVISDIPVVGTINRLLGAAFGFLKGGILVFVVFLIYSIYNGMYLDLLWQRIPEVMTIVEQVKEYLQQLWSMAM